MHRVEALELVPPFCKLGELAWGQKMPQKYVSSIGRSHMNLLRDEDYKKLSQDQGRETLGAQVAIFKSSAPFVPSLLYLLLKEKFNNDFWGLSLFQAYQSCRALIRL